MGVVTCEEVLGRNEFKSYSEFILMMCIGREYHRVGYVFDVRSMNVPKDIIGDHQLNMYKWLVYNKEIDAGVQLTQEPSFPNLYEFNMDAITVHEGNLFEEKEDCYMWSNTWAKKQYYGEYDLDLYNVGRLGTILIHLVAHLIVSIREGKIPKKSIVVFVDGLIGKSTDSYVNLVSCRRTIDWFRDLVDVKTDFDNKSTDVEFSLFINDGVMAGRNKPWTTAEKLNQLKEQGIVENSICIMFERSGLADTNRVGKIVNSRIIRVNKIDVKNAQILVTVIPLYRTKEEIIDDYNQIPDDLQYMFADMLSFNVKLFDMVIGLYSVGVCNYLYDEENFIMPIDEYGEVTKLVSVGGKCSSLVLSQREAVYWLLCQYEVEFDRGLYKAMYNNGNPMLYDMYETDF